MDNINILIVDDVFANRLLLSSALEGLSMNSKALVNGQQAVDILAEKTFDMVLLDIEMPVMNGYETVCYIRDEMPEVYDTTPIVAITAHSIAENKEKLLKAGFVEVFSKPYSVDKLEQLINKYVKRD